MFGLFKRKKDRLSNWSVPIDPAFERIENGDSTQFVNDDGSRILYCSLLTVSGKTSILGEVYKNMTATITSTNDGWQLKGAKDAGVEILICVLSFTEESDRQWAQDVFDGISYTKG